ncbi:Piwi-like protein 1, partial [Durusdinium trenchii]
MYHCKYLSREPNEDGIKDTTPKTGAGGKSVKLKTNCFRIVFDTGEFLHRYVYELPEGASQEKEIMFFEQAWSGIKAQLEHFVIRCPGYIFSPTMVGDFTVKLPSGEEMKIKYVSKLPTEQLNLGKLGPSAVVGQHVASKLAEPFKNQKLGKRYYNNCPQAAKGVLACLSGFSVASVTNACSSGVLLQLDAVHRPLGLKSVTDALYEACQAFESDVWAYRRDPAVADEWERYCVDSTVVTQYNSRVYRIKAVHFDKSPHDEFSMFVRDRKEYTKISFLKYFEAFYQIGPAHPTQPLLEAYPEKVGETVYLLPELCVPTGVTDEMRK